MAIIPPPSEDSQDSTSNIGKEICIQRTKSNEQTIQGTLQLRQFPYS